MKMLEKGLTNQGLPSFCMVPGILSSFLDPEDKGFVVLSFFSFVTLGVLIDSG